MANELMLAKSNKLDSKEQKLVILFVFDKMSIPLSEATVLDMCTSDNSWLTYMECKQYLAELLDTNLIYRVPKANTLNLTQDGVSCLSLSYMRIPTSIREEIASYVRENRMRFRKKQEYFCDYSKNADGTYTVIMRIDNSSGTIMELKMVVANRQRAMYIYKNWLDKAAGVYTMLQENLVE